SLANAVTLLGQQVGLATNGRDAAERLAEVGFQRTTDETADTDDWQTAKRLRAASSEVRDNERRQPQVIPAGRGVDQFQGIREVRRLASEEMLSDLCQSEVNRTPYMMSVG